MKNGDRIYLRHIADAIATIEEYLTGLTCGTFGERRMVVDAVVRELEIIGEAAGNVSETFRSEHPELPVQLMVGMRNRLIHEYFGVKTDVVWDTCMEDLPRLKEIVLSVLEEA
jgi:uncharacterized protein with HEPN domain